MTDNTDRTSGASAPETVRDTAPSVAPAQEADKREAARLSTLSSGFVAEHHQTYVRHLQQAVAGPKNLNIALTGRYGTGKSSILDKFESSCDGKTTVRVAISTLGPQSDTTPEGEAAKQSLSNRIQKELVKQLLYRAAPRAMRFTRFNRIVPTAAPVSTVLAVIAVPGPRHYPRPWHGFGHSSLLRSAAAWARSSNPLVAVDDDGSRSAAAEILSADSRSIRVFCSSRFTSLPDSGARGHSREAARGARRAGHSRRRRRSIGSLPPDAGPSSHTVPA